MMENFRYSPKSCKLISFNQLTLKFSARALTNYPLSIIHYPLSIIHYPLSIIHYPLSIIHYPLSIIHYPLSIIHYPIFLTFVELKNNTSVYLINEELSKPCEILAYYFCPSICDGRLFSWS